MIMANEVDTGRQTREGGWAGELTDSGASSAQAFGPARLDPPAGGANVSQPSLGVTVNERGLRQEEATNGPEAAISIGNQDLCEPQLASKTSKLRPAALWPEEKAD